LKARGKCGNIRRDGWRSHRKTIRTTNVLE
jgi:hypothetical protein